ncbi:TIGR03668 family PPOX class F420-dependent oxidoreductase [Nocardia rhamnosiphila]|uniref:TIGR03668 family PPOX class F420-dependent oxidoreductase n=1 Tax=Nocardia rhamnosiphila TaxID=426716 RepID=UPI0004C2B633|nr:TIGR03668 family PPOX class F420-dependent oxidoreductase [Nocardia rhamnosiphila]
MRLDRDRARTRFAAARVARLATVTTAGAPHLVPIVFALAGDTVYTAVDAKPKSTTALRRLANIEANPEIAVLADFYDEDWTRLWWVRADGRARIVTGDEARHGLTHLTARYPVYVTEPPPGPVIALDIARWSGWAAS